VDGSKVSAAMATAANRAATVFIRISKGMACDPCAMADGEPRSPASSPRSVDRHSHKSLVSICPSQGTRNRSVGHGHGQDPADWPDSSLHRAGAQHRVLASDRHPRPENCVSSVSAFFTGTLAKYPSPKAIHYSTYQNCSAAVSRSVLKADVICSLPAAGRLPSTSISETHHQGKGLS
jgi:hypothetical protein